jgi:pimeloyl-ACP methyl ester carboxylesterase
MRRWGALLVCGALACDSRGLDGADLRGVFDPRPSASAPALAKPEGSAAKKKKKKGEPEEVLPELPPATERAPIPGPCAAEGGEPGKRSERIEGRPACRRARFLESRDPDSTPRYGCVFEPADLAKKKPLPLVVFLHGEDDDPTAVSKKTRLLGRYKSFDMRGDPQRTGFVVLAPQARRFTYKLRWDVGHVSRDNLDARAIDRFVEELIGEGSVDPAQIYVIGESRGGAMAALYAYLRPDRVVAFGAYGATATELDWTCAGAPPPAAIVYRSCDAAVPCVDVERWLRRRDDERAPTFSLRLGAGKATEPACATVKSRCNGPSAQANHHRWPKPREGEMLEFLSRFSFAR